MGEQFKGRYEQLQPLQSKQWKSFLNGLLKHSYPLTEQLNLTRDCLWQPLVLLMLPIMKMISIPLIFHKRKTQLIPKSK